MNFFDMNDEFYQAATTEGTAQPFPIGALQPIDWATWDAVYCAGGEL